MNICTDNLKEIIDVFSNLLEAPVIIAGGAVRDTLLGRVPKDYDLFIPKQRFNDWKEYREKDAQVFTDRLAQFAKVKAVVDWHKSEPFLIESIMYKDAEVQIMATPEPDAQSLIKTFDWNVCLFARDLENTYGVDGLNSIGEGKELILNRCTFPASTLRRGFRFSERFKMKLRTEDLKAICKQIVGNN